MINKASIISHPLSLDGFYRQIARLGIQDQPSGVFQVRVDFPQR
jgi:hypothetical protein